MMTERDDLVFLTGFIIGTYDLKGNEKPPAYITSIIDRVMNPVLTTAPRGRIINEPSPQEVCLVTEDTVKEAMRRVADVLPEETEETPPAFDPAPTKSDEEKIEEFIADGGEKKYRKPWSPRARAAAAERMRLRHLEKKKNIESSVPDKPYVTVTAEKLLENHNSYAGERDPNQKLADEDWSDIEIMYKKKRMSVTQIAGIYHVDFDTMRKFIDDNA